MSWAGALRRWSSTSIAVALILASAGVEAANPQAAAYLKLLQSGRVPAQNVPTVLELICGKGDADDLKVVYDRVVDPAGLSAAVRGRAMANLADAMETRKVKPAGDLSGIVGLMQAGQSVDVRRSAMRLAAVWQVTAARGEYQAVASDDAADERLRAAALDGLVRLSGDESRTALLPLTAEPWPLGRRYQAVAALAAIDVETAAERAAAALAVGTVAESPGNLIEAFLTIKQGPERLAAALEKRKPPKDVAKMALRAMYAFGHNDAVLSAVLSEAAGVQADPPKPTPDEVARIVKLAAEQGDASRGEEVFRRADVGCLKCHAVVRAGGSVGPELSPIGASSPAEYIVTSILDPNAAIKEQYLTRNFETSDGRIVTGIVIDRNAERVRVKDANNREIVLPVAEIEEEIEGRSLMPVGVTKFLTQDEVLDLVRFLSELGRPGPYGPRPTATIQRWRVARSLPAELGGDDADPEQLRTFLQEDKPDAWSSVYAKVSGELPLRDAVDPRQKASTLLLQGEFEVTESGPIGLRIKTPPGATVWLDGSPLNGTGDLVPNPPLAAGRHKVSLRVARPDSDERLAVEFFLPPESTAKFAVIGGL